MSEGTLEGLINAVESLTVATVRLTSVMERASKGLDRKETKEAAAAEKPAQVKKVEKPEEPAAEAAPAEEEKAATSAHSRDDMVGKLKELVPATSRATAEGVIEAAAGEGITKSRDVPEDKIDAVYDAVVAKIAQAKAAAEDEV